MKKKMKETMKMNILSDFLKIVKTDIAALSNAMNQFEIDNNKDYANALLIIHKRLGSNLEDLKKFID